MTALKPVCKATLPPLQGGMQTAPQDLLARLAALDIETTTYEHPAVFTVAEAAALRGELPGGHCKCLFLKDRKDGLWLVVALEDRRIDLKALSDFLGAHRFSFGSAPLLAEILGVTPGSVTPFALLNDTQCQVQPLLDAEMLTYDPLNYHPLTNTKTTALAPAGLLKFIVSCGHRPRIVNFHEIGLTPPAAQAGEAAGRAAGTACQKPAQSPSSSSS